MFRVVIVEDELIVRQGLLLTTPWENYDCKVIGDAKNGKEGLDLIIKCKPDIVITDIKMPIMDGIEMIEKVLQHYNPVIIFITAFNDFNYAKKAIDFRVIDYLIKPFNDNQLDVALNKARLKVQERILQQEQTSSEFEQLANLRKRLSDSTNSKHINIINALNYIKKHYSEELTVSKLAETLNISESYLSHLFKEETSYTVIEYLTHYRLSIACQMLRDPNMRINVIATLVGYQDQRYFSQIFKKHLGLTPKQYQQNF